MDSLDYRQYGLPPELVRSLEALGFERLTEVQAKSLPVLRAGRDLLAQSRTGSGKTIAFALPLLERIDLRSRAIQALVLCPTRELCTQVAATVRALGRFHPNLLVT